VLSVTGTSGRDKEASQQVRTPAETAKDRVSQVELFAAPGHLGGAWASSEQSWIQLKDLLPGRHLQESFCFVLLAMLLVILITLERIKSAFSILSAASTDSTNHGLKIFFKKLSLY
jgi:hypothetical protein